MVLGRRRNEGDRIGAYEVVRYLASGGMGDVYEARDTRTQATVALKLLGDRAPLAVVRFEREARIATELQHPHIVAIHGHGRDDEGLPYIAMELLRGEDLHHRLARGPIDPAELATIAMQVCTALDFAHSRGVVHRDLKPENIFLSSTVALDSPIDARVLDFGIARVAGERGLTVTGGIVGTLDYISPEQAGSAKDLDFRTDLWSLGVVLYECLAGRVPFTSETVPGVLFQILLDDPPALATICPDAPRGLVDLVTKLLAKRREDRHQSARAVHDALDALGIAVANAKFVAGPPVVTDANATARTIVPDQTSPTMLNVPALDSSGESDDEGNVESRPVSVVYLRHVRDALLATDLARQAGGEALQLRNGDVLVIFGMTQWHADEVVRAVRFAASAALVAACIGVATGKAVRGLRRTAGVAIDAAVALAQRDGISLDAATTSAVTAHFELTRTGDGTSRLDPRAHVDRGTVPEVAPLTPFVGRDLERSLLLAALDTASESQQPSGVVMIGAPGLGKSRLRYEATTALLSRDPDATILLARCDAVRRDTPFAAIRDLLADLGDSAIDGALESAIQHAGGDPQAAVDRVRGTLESVLRGASDRSAVVLVIDDAHWLDASSRASIRWLCENASDVPIALWLFARPEAREALRDLVAASTTHEIAPLSAAASAELVRAIVGGAAPEPLLERAAGHPLALEEFGHAYARRGQASLHDGSIPLTVEGAIVAQLDRLGGSERDFLKRASVFGRTAWIEGVSALGGEQDGLPALKKQGLASPKPRSRLVGAHEFTIRSGLLQEVAYGLWTEKHRVGLHTRAGEWMSAQSGSTPDEIARHWELAGDLKNAAAAYVAAAEVAAHVNDEQIAVHVARALALTQDASLRFRVLVAQDTALQLGTDRDTQRRGLDELARLGERLGPAERAEIAWRHCYFARITSDHASAASEGARAIALATSCGVLRWAAAAENELALLCANEARFDDAKSHAVRAEDYARSLDDAPTSARALFTKAYVLTEEGDDLAACVVLHQRTADAYASIGNRRREAIALSNGGFAMLQLGRIADAMERFESAIVLSRKVGNARSAAVATQNRATIHRMLGNFEQARNDLAFAASEARRLRFARLEAAVSIEQGYLALAQRAGAEDLVRAAEDAERFATASRSPLLATSASALALRAFAHAGLSVAAACTPARERVATGDLTADACAELAVAVWDAGGRGTDDRAAARDAIQRFSARVARVEERAECRTAFATRYLADDLR